MSHKPKLSNSGMFRPRPSSTSSEAPRSLQMEQRVVASPPAASPAPKAVDYLGMRRAVRPYNIRRSQDAVDTTQTAYRTAQTEFAGNIRNYDPISPELKPQFQRVQQAADAVQQVPGRAAPRELRGFGGGLQTLGYTTQATRDPQSGAYNPAAAGIAALLALAFGDKGRVGQAVADAYDQPALDRERQTAMQNYQVQSGMLKDQMPLHRNQQDNELRARQIELGQKESDYKIALQSQENLFKRYLQEDENAVDAQDKQERRAIDAGKLRQDRYDLKLDGGNGYLLDRRTGDVSRALGSNQPTAADRDLAKSESNNLQPVVADMERYAIEVEQKVSAYQTKHDNAKRTLQAIQDGSIRDKDGSLTLKAQNEMNQAVMEKRQLARDAFQRAEQWRASFPNHPGIISSSAAEVGDNENPWFKLDQEALRPIKQKSLNYAVPSVLVNPYFNNMYKYGTPPKQ